MIINLLSKEIPNLVKLIPIASISVMLTVFVFAMLTHLEGISYCEVAEIKKIVPIEEVKLIVKTTELSPISTSSQLVATNETCQTCAKSNWQTASEITAVVVLTTLVLVAGVAVAVWYFNVKFVVLWVSPGPEIIFTLPPVVRKN